MIDVVSCSPSFGRILSDSKLQRGNDTFVGVNRVGRIDGVVSPPKNIRMKASVIFLQCHFRDKIPQEFRIR